MKIQKASWEKTNLGVDCVEIECEVNDPLILVEKTIDGYEKNEYNVIKIPSGRIDIIKVLEKKGYSFAETNIGFELSLSNYQLPSSFSIFKKAYTYKQINDFSMVSKEIKKGIFDTDKIALDSFFSIEKSANRFVNWTKSELEKNSFLFEIYKADTAIGFFVLKQESPILYNSLLAGMYLEYKNCGMGAVSLTFPVLEAIKRGGKLIRAGASSNNLQSVKIHSALGYCVVGLKYVMIKHCS